MNNNPIYAYEPTQRERLGRVLLDEAERQYSEANRKRGESGVLDPVVLTVIAQMALAATALLDGGKR